MIHNLTHTSRSPAAPSAYKDPVIEVSSVADLQDGQSFVASAIEVSCGWLAGRDLESTPVLIKHVLQACGNHGRVASPRRPATHLVVGEARRTLKVLHALARGLWIVTPAWVYQSQQCGFWVQEDEYEATGLFPGAPLARLRAQSIFFQRQFYVPKVLQTRMTRKELVQLIEEAGGDIVASARASHNAEVLTVVGQMRAGSAEDGRVSVSWVLDCLTEARFISLQEQTAVDSDEM